MMTSFSLRREEEERELPILTAESFACTIDRGFAFFTAVHVAVTSPIEYS